MNWIHFFINFIENKRWFKSWSVGNCNTKTRLIERGMNEDLLRSTHTRIFNLSMCVVHRFSEFTIHGDHSFYIVLAYFIRFSHFKSVFVPTVCILRYLCIYAEKNLCACNAKKSHHNVCIIFYDVENISSFYLSINKQDKNDIKCVFVCVWIRLENCRKALNEWSTTTTTTTMTITMSTTTRARAGNRKDWLRE